MEHQQTSRARHSNRKGCYSLVVIVCSFLVIMLSISPAAAFTVNFVADYHDALTKSILFYEAQRSGKLPTIQRATWRQDSGLNDGISTSSKVNLTGGYYDAGDNVKFGFPLAFSITMLSWSTLEYRGWLDKAGELDHAQDAIRWGTDYLLKAYTGPTELWVQVGDPASDHSCWERPEDMDTPRTAYKINAQNPGSDVAAETAAALAAASMVFQTTDMPYSARLLTAARQLFTFADRYRGSYSDALSSVVCPFYCSYSGYKDELLWGATWLYKASRDAQYVQYIVNNGASLGGLNVTTSSLNWDNKYAGAQVLLSQINMGGTCYSTDQLAVYKIQADKFMCMTMPGLSTSRTPYTPGGLLFYQSASNLQYASTTAFLMMTYAKHLSSSSSMLICGSTAVDPSRLTAMAKQQVDYILGNNPLKKSYMVGFGSNYPLHVHHRASSLPSLRFYPSVIRCGDGWSWYSSSNPNPNLLVGAVVGGPDNADRFNDARAEYMALEPAMYINAPLVGMLAMLANSTG